MDPLHVTATLTGAIALPTRHLALDALLMSAVAIRDQLPPLLDASQATPLEIPIEREPEERFHLASFGEYEVQAHEHRWLNRRFPLPEAQAMGGPKLKRVLLSGGPTKSYRLPMETLWLVDDRIEWWCIGDADAIRELLGLVSYLGKKRSTGLGKVARWTVEECELVWEGFPVVRKGRPLRALPLDWLGLADPSLAMSTLSPPYWDHTKEQLCAVPM